MKVGDPDILSCVNRDVGWMADATARDEALQGRAIVREFRHRSVVPTA